MKSEQDFQEALKNKKIPILVLDQKWHRLFAIHGKTDAIKSLEEEVNGLLVRQGQLNTKLKELKKLKNQLMSNIVANMNDEKTEDKEHLRHRKLDEDKRLIDEINTQLPTYKRISKLVVRTEDFKRSRAMKILREQ